MEDKEKNSEFRSAETPEEKEGWLSAQTRKTCERLNDLPLRKQKLVLLAFFAVCILMLCVNILSAVRGPERTVRTEDAVVVSPISLPSAEKDSIINNVKSGKPWMKKEKNN